MSEKTSLDAGQKILDDIAFVEWKNNSQTKIILASINEKLKEMLNLAMARRQVGKDAEALNFLSQAKAIVDILSIMEKK